MSKSTKLWNLVKHIPPYLFKVFIYLSHYSAPVASLTLQRNSYVVYLSRSNASPSSFTSLSPFIPLHSVSLYKNSRVLNSPYFSIPFFFQCFHCLFVCCFLYQLTTKLAVQIYMRLVLLVSSPLFPSSILPLGSSKPTSLLSQPWTSPVDAG